MSHNESGDTEARNSASKRAPDWPVTGSRRNCKAIIKVTPIPLEQWPGATLPSPQFTLPQSLRPEALEASSILEPTPTCGGRSPIPGLPAQPRPHLTPSGGAALNYQGVSNLAILCLRDLDHSCNSCYETRSIGNSHPATHSPRNNAAIIVTPTQFLNEDRDFAARNQSHTPGSSSGAWGPACGEALVQSQGVDLSSSTNSRQDSPVRINSFHFEAQNDVAITALTPSTHSNGPLPTEPVFSHNTRSSIRQRDADDAFLDVTQGNSREPDDSLERGMMRNQIEVETGFSTGLEFSALSPRTRVAITVVILGTLLLGAVTQLAQVIKPATSTH